MSWLDRTLDLFDRHKYGVIGTLLVHTVLMAVFVLGRLDSREVYHEPPPILLVMDDLEEPEMDRPEEQDETMAAANVPVTNLASNVTGERMLSSAARERIAQNVERDLLDMERGEFDRLAEERKAEGREIVVPELDPSKFDKRNYMKEEPKPVKVEGLTTVSYDLEGRTHRVLEVPAYLCKGSGKIVVRVAVDRTGEVVKAELDPAASTAVTGCMAENALSSASGARFSASPKAAQPQRGTITYVFLAQ